MLSMNQWLNTTHHIFLAVSSFNAYIQGTCIDGDPCSRSHNLSTSGLNSFIQKKTVAIEILCFTSAPSS